MFLDCDWWRALSRRKRKGVGRCERCHTKKRLQAHHKHYPDNWFDTTEADLEVLCRKCHKQEHGISDQNWDSENVGDSAIPKHAFQKQEPPPKRKASRPNMVAFPVKDRCPYSDVKALEAARSERLITREQFVRWKKFLTKPKPRAKWHYAKFTTESGRRTIWQSRGRSSN